MVTSLTTTGAGVPGSRAAWKNNFYLALDICLLVSYLDGITKQQGVMYETTIY
jgi:hypothetical protein